MILYDNKSNFLGIGQNELSLLGYEDLEEFKKNFSDFADLFVDKPGYISKFKNFSWIDYALHSGTPNKNIILKHKNGTEVKTQLLISEIPLMNDINGALSIYCIELDTKTAPNIQNLTEAENNLTELDKHIEQEENIDQNIYNETIEEPISSIENTNHFEELIISDYSEQETDDEQSANIRDETQEENSDNFKLHVEENLVANEENKIKSNFEDNNPEEIEEKIKLKVFFDEDKDKPKEIEDDLNNTRVDIPELHQDKELEAIDFAQIAEDTGMNLGDIAEFIGEFIGESEKFLQEIENDTNDDNFIKNGAMQLKGISSILKMKQITESLNSIVENCDNSTIKQQIYIFRKNIESLEEQLL